MTKLSKFGVFLTVVYLLAVAIIAIANWTDFGGLKPNEWGDFLAGAFGPLAIFWLVLGFFQQGSELRHSVEALELQAEELKNSVAQQKAMVGITGKQLELDIAVRDEQSKFQLAMGLPLLQIRAAGHQRTGSAKPSVDFKYFLVNIGADAQEINLELNSKKLHLRPTEFSFTPNQTEYIFYINVEGGTDFPEESDTILTAKMYNLRGQMRSQIFRIGNFQPEQLDCDPPQA